jgi:hypothetical protein
VRHNENFPIFRVTSVLIDYVGGHSLGTWSLFLSRTAASGLCSSRYYIHGSLVQPLAQPPPIHLNGAFTIQLLASQRSQCDRLPLSHAMSTTASAANPNAMRRRRRPGSRWVCASSGKACLLPLPTAITSRCEYLVDIHCSRPANQGSRAQRNAEESDLLRLPPEIRNRIWEYVGQELLACHDEENVTYPEPGILRVCRQSHAETCLPSYALNTF